MVDRGSDDAVPMILPPDSVSPYLAALAVFLLLRKHTEIRSVALPGLGTGVGQLGPNTCAIQVRAAIDDIVLERYTTPRTWAEASERHQLLYTDRPHRLQH